MLFVIAIAAGWMTDKLFPKQERFLINEDHELEIHQEELCRCFSAEGILPQLCLLLLFIYAYLKTIHI